MIKKALLLCVAALVSANAAAQMFVDGLENFSIAPQFPLVGGQFQLTPGPASTQLQWLLGELAVGQTTTVTEVNAHFDASWLAQFDAAATISFINTLRSDYPNARVTDVISVTPMRITALIDTPGSPLPSGFLQFGTRFTGSQGIVLLGVSGFTSTMFGEDTTLSLAQAADKFLTLSSAPGLLIARINPQGQCMAIEDRNGLTPRALASIFKVWVLGGVASAIRDGTLSSAESLTLDGTRNVAGSVITSEPNGTVFSASQLATMMMGNSDNTATDILLTRVGRARINQTVSDFNFATPTLLTPVLGISEQFHLLFSFDLATANSYVNGTEAFQNTFLTNNIVPLGRFISGPFANSSLLTDGTWRAAPYDICNAFSALRRFPGGSEAINQIDRALGAQAAQPLVRGQWDRVWYKGGNLASATNVNHVFTHAWMLEDAGRDPFVLIALSNSASGAIDQNVVFQIQSVTGRMLQLLAQMP